MITVHELWCHNDSNCTSVTVKTPTVGNWCFKQHSALSSYLVFEKKFISNQ